MRLSDKLKKDIWLSSRNVGACQKCKVYYEDVNLGKANNCFFCGRRIQILPRGKLLKYKVLLLREPNNHFIYRQLKDIGGNKNAKRNLRIQTSTQTTGNAKP